MVGTTLPRQLVVQRAARDTTPVSRRPRNAGATAPSSVPSRRPPRKTATPSPVRAATAGPIRLPPGPAEAPKPVEVQAIGPASPAPIAVPLLADATRAVLTAPKSTKPAPVPAVVTATTWSGRGRPTRSNHSTGANSPTTGTSRPSGSCNSKSSATPGYEQPKQPRD